jgi:hypothetical protein
MTIIRPGGRSAAQSPVSVFAVSPLYKLTLTHNIAVSNKKNTIYSVFFDLFHKSLSTRQLQNLNKNMAMRRSAEGGFYRQIVKRCLI